MGTASMLHLEAGLEEVGTTENTDRHEPVAPIQRALEVGQAQVLPTFGGGDAELASMEMTWCQTQFPPRV